MKTLSESERKKIHEVRSLIHDAFPHAEGDKADTLSHGECANLMVAPETIDSQELQHILYLIFERVIYDYLHDNTLTFVEMLVMYLDQDKFNEKFAFMAHPGDTETDRINFERHKNFYIEKNNHDMNSITQDQAYAIWMWLDMIKAWPDLSCYIEEIERAMPYWKMRAGM